jgi:hypothetical protein
MDTNLETVSRIVKALQHRGAKVLLVDSPINPRFLDAYVSPEIIRAYKAALHRVAADLDVPLFEFNQAAALKENEFQDVMHVVGDAVKRRCQTELANHLLRVGYFVNQEGLKP